MPVWKEQNKQQANHQSEAADFEIGRVPVTIMCYMASRISGMGSGSEKLK